MYMKNIESPSEVRKIDLSKDDFTANDIKIITEAMRSHSWSKSQEIFDELLSAAGADFSLDLDDFKLIFSPNRESKIKGDGFGARLKRVIESKSRPIWAMYMDYRNSESRTEKYLGNDLEIINLASRVDGIEYDGEYIDKANLRKIGMFHSIFEDGNINLVQLVESSKEGFAQLYLEQAKSL